MGTQSARLDWPRLTSDPYLNVLGAVYELAVMDAYIPQDKLVTVAHRQLQADARAFLEQVDLPRLLGAYSGRLFHVPRGAKPLAVRKALGIYFAESIMREPLRANNRLRAIMDAQHISMIKLSKRAGSVSTISAIINGNHVPRAELRRKFAQALNVSEAEIWPDLPCQG